MALSSIWIQSNKVADIFVATLSSLNGIGQPNKENNFSKQRAIETLLKFTKFIERGNKIDLFLERGIILGTNSF